METDLMKICKQVRDTAEEAGEYIRSQSPGMIDLTVREKGVHDYVTHVDITSEKMITDRLQKIIPGAGMIAEETSPIQAASRYVWIVDPLDGTTNFLHGLPPYSISIALMDGDEIVVGVVYDIPAADFFYSWKEAYAYHNGTRIKVSQTETVRHSLVATGFPYSSFHRIDPYLNTLRFLMENCGGVRRMGSAAIDLSYVACGRFDAFWEYGLNIWDVAAGSIIIQQAGGSLSDFSGGNSYLRGKEIIAANPLVFDEFRSEVSLRMNP
jgi:myo-inositol-1(or 4)-monophosphatase